MPENDTPGTIYRTLLSDVNRSVLVFRLWKQRTSQGEYRVQDEACPEDGDRFQSEVEGGSPEDRSDQEKEKPLERALGKRAKKRLDRYSFLN